VCVCVCVLGFEVFDAVWNDYTNKITQKVMVM